VSPLLIQYEGLLWLAKVAFISEREVAYGSVKCISDMKHTSVRIRSCSGARPGIRVPPRFIPFRVLERRHMGRTMVAFTENRGIHDRRRNGLSEKQKRREVFGPCCSLLIQFVLCFSLFLYFFLYFHTPREDGRKETLISWQ